MAKAFIHPLADVEEGAQIGDNSFCWRWTHIMPEVKIGNDCVIGQNCFVQNGVEIGDRVHIQNNVSVYTGVKLEDDTFIGPSVVFTNVRKPSPYEVIATSCYAKTIVHKGVSIGANATIVCGVEIGENSLIGAGAVVTKNVPPNVCVIGNPAGILVRSITGESFVVSFENYYIKKR